MIKTEHHTLRFHLKMNRVMTLTLETNVTDSRQKELVIVNAQSLALELTNRLSLVLLEEENDWEPLNIVLFKKWYQNIIT